MWRVKIMRVELGQIGQFDRVSDVNAAKSEKTKRHFAQIFQDPVDMNAGQSANLGEVGLRQGQAKGVTIRLADFKQADIHFAQEMGKPRPGGQTALTKDPLSVNCRLHQADRPQLARQIGMGAQGLPQAVGVDQGKAGCRNRCNIMFMLTWGWGAEVDEVAWNLQRDDLSLPQVVVDMAADKAVQQKRHMPGMQGALSQIDARRNVDYILDQPRDDWTIQASDALGEDGFHLYFWIDSLRVYHG
nr:hypothetical protein [Rhodobacter sp. KR11]